MTIKQFLNLKYWDSENKSELVPSDAKLCFQFKDEYGIVWNARNYAWKFAAHDHILNFPFDLTWNKDKESLYTFNLDLNKPPKNIFTTCSEIYEDPARTSEAINTVWGYLHGHYIGKPMPKVFFRQKILVMDVPYIPMDDFSGYSFTTRNPIDPIFLEEVMTMNGPFSDLLVYDVETEDDIIIVEFFTNATKLEEFETSPCALFVPKHFVYYD